MNMSNLLSLGIVGAIAFFVWTKWDDIQGMFGSANQVNPFTQIPAFFDSQILLAQKQAELETKYSSIEKDILARKEDIARIDAAQTEYDKTDAYKQSYEKEQAHLEGSFATKPLTFTHQDQTMTFHSADEYLQWTLRNKGFSKQETDYISGQTSVNPTQQDTAIRIPLQIDTSGFIAPGQGTISGTSSNYPIPASTIKMMVSEQVVSVKAPSPAPSPPTTNQEFYLKQLESGAFTQGQYDHNMKYFS